VGVLVKPVDAGFALEPGSTLLAGATLAGWRWPSVCGGMAECGTCAVEVVDGAALLDDACPLEVARIAQLPSRKTRPEAYWRLACQARLKHPGELTVRKPGARPR
jgi:2Fe-2S ferredoxin